MGSVKRLHEFFSFLEDDLATVKPKEGYQAFAVARQRERAKKRARLGDSSLSEKAVRAFIDLNAEVGAFNLHLSPDVACNARAFISMALERYATTASELNIQETLDYANLLDNWRFGPGASFDTDGTHAAMKIGQPWSVTSSAVAVVKRLRRNHPYLYARDSIEGGNALKVVRGCELLTVHKNEEKDRTISKQPLGNMCAQLAAGAVLEGALRCIGLDIRTQQTRNQFMARYGSLTGAFCTIDEKSASDRIKPDLVRLLFPPEWFELLWSLRTAETLLPNGEWLPLNMMSTMGNGFTFPMMTLLIVALIYGFRCQSPGSPNLWIDWSTTCVFGDDIIVPTTEYAGLTSVLEASGFVTNHDKSYFSGPFRESCGGDYYYGVEVTPFYVESLDCDADIYVAINKIVEWAALVDVLPLAALMYLFRQLDNVLFVPEWDQPTAGFLTTQVRHRYKRLVPKVEEVELKDEFFLMPLACQGYVTGSIHSDTQSALKKGIWPWPTQSSVRRQKERANAKFVPRTFKPRYHTVESRLPRGFLDGRAPDSRSPQASRLAEFVGFMGSVVVPDSGRT